MNNVDRYIRQTGRHMQCPKKYKDPILAEYKSTIHEFGDLSNCPMQVLYEKFDYPRIAAKNLLDEVPESVLRIYKIHRTIALMVLMLLIITGFVVGGIVLLESQDYKTSIIDPWELTTFEQ